MWYTTDGGATLSYVDTKSEMWDVKVNPTKPGWLIATRFSDCCWSINPPCASATACKACCDGEVYIPGCTF